MTWRLVEDDDSKRVVDFLRLVDGYFYPPLHLRVDIDDYAIKLAHHATNFFLVAENRDIAHSAFYCNNAKYRVAFLSSLSIHPEFRGSGAAGHILQETVKACHQRGMVRLRLEVDARNLRAVKFYLKQGFRFVSDDLMERSFLEVNGNAH
ncbi:GNAT family N-acetyltransferase [Alloalcanivorax marinus]|uniref:GNAT family N-acetyltransferase n=1 Tax=Alloalcanivorax marinus TaxID=1177169 RepID=UPI0021CF7D24|nr:GNAT family N-acetyltransferase [Alloalcanivorax marinus]